jgi:FkbM family methyltransferase
MSRSVDRAAARLARLLGLKLVGVRDMHAHALAEHLRLLFRHLRIDCVFDVGANAGQYYRLLRREVGYRGLVVSFEPVPALAAQLARKAVRDPLWIVRPVALGATPGTMSINVMAASVFSSFLPPDHTHTATVGSQNIVERVQPVAVDTLDRVAAEILQSHPVRSAYLKLDTQGFDLEVFKGAQATLPIVAALQSELSFVPIYVGMPPWREALDTYSAAGFAVSALFPVNQDEKLRLLEADCVLVRSASTGRAA